MNLKTVTELIGADVLCVSERLEEVEVEYAYAADLMSDVLAFARPMSLLLTGLTNVQIIRTAQMLDIPAVVFVRGKRPQEEVVTLARQVKMPLLFAKKSMYETCGLLYKAGVLPCEIPERGGDVC
ncbi:DRTGG domain-containing protein [Aminiphilus sp.]|jgi:predicted transcriptional regulator|uniref:DRTGG domain-containing protein n=1 Tax=Aminiphilus sp. TaxID=1872488 RepID=UPI001BCCE50C|nr:DRTGG domain-containing protein [Aminiphilus sp.]